VTAALHGCGDEAETATTSAPPSARTTTGADCSELVPTSVVSALGWTETGAAALEAGRCTQQFDGGQLAAGQLAVGGTSSADLPENGEARFDELCAELGEGTSAGGAGESVDWLGDGTSGCAVTSDDGAGVNSLIALNAEGILVQASVQPDEPTDPSTVETALTDLAQNAIERAG
jgi:hypothetical protein